MELNPEHQFVRETAIERVRSYITRQAMIEPTTIPGESSDDAPEGKN